MWGMTLASMPTIMLAVLTLVVLEGLLSADNALVLAVMVRHLPKSQQKRALRYGIWGAFLFRLIAVVFAYQLIQFWQLKVLGGLYLVYLVLKHFTTPEHDETGERKRRFGEGFWPTVVNVELADVAFSIDSILAAVGMVESLPANLQENKTLALTIIYVGGVLGIIMMRLVAGVFLLLLDRYKGLAGGAYVMVGWIGLKLIGSGLQSALDLGWRSRVPGWIGRIPWELPDWGFWVGMALIVVGSLLYKPHRQRETHDRKPDDEPDSVEDIAGEPAAASGGSDRDSSAMS